MHPKDVLGRRGEDLATSMYERQGFRVLERNVRSPAGEIDVIARRGALLVFCEVKTRRTDRWGLPAEAVHPAKQQRMRRLAAEWLAERRPGPVEVRFDVVSVIVHGRCADVTHIPAAF